MRKYIITTLTCLAFAACEKQTAIAQLIAADDFIYNQPTKAFGAGGGFLGQDHAGGANGNAGAWTTPWISTGDGVITGSDITEEAGFNVELDAFQGATRNGLSENHLQRGFSVTDAGEVLYFGTTVRNSAEGAASPLFTLNDPGGTSQISMGFSEGGLVSFLGETTDSIEGPGLTDGVEPYQLIGKLELNAAGDEERLTVWLDPVGVEDAENTFSIEADVLGGIEDLAGVMRLDHNFSPSIVLWDNVALGTTWESVASVNVPRASLVIDVEGEAAAIVNNTDITFDAIYYDISSANGQINSGNWTTLESQGVDSWVASPASNELLVESQLSGSTNIEPGDQLRLGNIGDSVDGDTMGALGTTDGLLNVLTVEFGTLASACDANSEGDIDGNGAVEFADFLILSGNFGTEVADQTQGDIDCNGTVEFADFLVLSANFGTQVGGVTSVPEPALGNISLIATLAGVAAWRRRRRA